MKKKLSFIKLVKLFLSALIPLLIGVFTVITTIQQHKFSSLQRDQDKQDALLLRQQSEFQADNLHKEKVYATYLDDISKLFTVNNDKETLTEIRAKTLASLRQLDVERRKHLLLFLYDIELIYRTPQRNVSSMLKLNDADFNGIYFRGTSETTCSFPYLYLHNVHLSNASFIDCFIDRANFSSSMLYKTVFFKTRFLRTSFNFALLDKSTFNRATFFETSFVGASLAECNFSDAFWTNQTVDFTGANMTGSILSNQRLTTSILENSILPNGTWGPIISTNLVVNGDAEQNNQTVDNTNLTGWYPSVPGILCMTAYKNQSFISQFGKYHFRVIPSYTLQQSISMTQNISFEIFTLLISAGMARYNTSVNFQCSGNQVGYFELFFVDLNGLRHFPISRNTSSGTQMGRLTVSNIFNSEMRSVQLKVAFIRDVKINTTTEENYCIADNIEFFITKVK